ncbi:ABC transporter permease subunit [Streptomyces carpaticus]|uniref:ABC transporter permease subunit n=1 Tax=Streptomyces carpaticus TaxID=285558 RepID=A0ABV4ZJ73_9ACTN
MRPRFRQLLAAEWIKLWSLRSSAWVLGAGALVVIAINVNAARSNADRLATLWPPPDGVDPAMMFDPMHTAFVGPAYQILVVIAGSAGALALFGEYTSGLMRTTLAAVPDRRAVVAAKAVVLGAVTLVLGAVVALTSFGVSQWLLREYGGLSLADPGAARAVAASALLAPLSALVGMAVAALIRHATGTVVTTIGVLLLLPALFGGDTYRWVAEIGNAMPLPAWQTLTRNPVMDFHPGRYPASVAQCWTVLAIWPLAALATAVTVVHRRDL